MNIPNFSGLSEQCILPSYPGYALGSVIPKGEFTRPLLQIKLEETEQKLQKLQQEKDSKITFYKEQQALKEEGQLAINTLSEEISAIKKTHQTVCNDLKQISQSQPLITVNEVLPIDFKRSRIKNESRSSLSENMQCMVITQESDFSEVFETFLRSLQIEGFPSPSLSSTTHQQVTDRIKNLLKESEVFLIGSFVTLDRVRIVDPICIREEATLGEQLLQTAKDSYVLAEAVLGGIFLGYGKKITNSSGSDETHASKVTMFSFISQGAIPIFEEQNLWSTYLSWKRQIIEGSNTGYPIGFKVRILTDVLRENHIKFDETSS